MPIIYHLAGRAEWGDGAASLKFGTGEYRAGSLAEEGLSTAPRTKPRC